MVRLNSGVLSEWLCAACHRPVDQAIAQETCRQTLLQGLYKAANSGLLNSKLLYTWRTVQCCLWSHAVHYNGGHMGGCAMLP